MNIQKLKQMIKEPASKEWFAKHGNKKQEVASKMHVSDNGIPFHSRKEGIEIRKNQGESAHNARRNEMIRAQLRHDRKHQ